MNKVALFDFCETLANFQTADAYVDFVRENLNDKRMWRLERIQNFLRKIKLIRVAEKLTKYKYSINKRIKLWQLRGIAVDDLQNLADRYYEERIKPDIISGLLERLLTLKKQGYSVFLVSGGYDFYLRCFAEEYELSGVISTRIGVKNGICTGMFDGIDCLRDGKIYLLNKYFTIKPKYSVAFSDSISDVPFLNWATKGYVVSKKKHQEWIDDYNFNEIIW